MPSKAQKLREHYGNEQARILNEIAGLGTLAAEMDPDIVHKVGGATLDALGEDVHVVEAAARAAAASEERDKLKSRYVEQELELRAALELAGEAADRELSPKEANAADLLAAASASPEALIAMMDLALSSGLEDAALLAFSVGRDRDLEEVTAHALTVGPDEWSELYTDLMEASSQPELDPADKFEAIASRYPAPTKQEILKQGQPDINKYGMMR
jgi:hypothetical protein